MLNGYNQYVLWTILMTLFEKKICIARRIDNAQSEGIIQNFHMKLYYIAIIKTSELSRTNGPL